MPRRAVPLQTPGGGDCFFHAVAAALGRPPWDVKAALKVRWNIAKRLAAVLFQPPHDNLATLTTAVMQAAQAPDLNAIVPTVGADADDARAAWGQMIAVPVPRNGNICPLAAWVVWLQYDAAQIEWLRFDAKKVGENKLAIPGFLHALEFLTYTLWGDSDLCAWVVTKITGKPVLVFTEGNDVEAVRDDNAINIFHVNDPPHFAAVRMVDLQVEVDEEKWEARASSASGRDRGTNDDPVPSISTCWAPEPHAPVIWIKPENMFLHACRPKSVSSQYASGPMNLPTGPPALELCGMILEHTRDVMAKAGPFGMNSVEDIDLATFPNPPVYVISGNRSAWLGSVFWSGQLFVGNLVRAKAGRPVIFVVDIAEAGNYRTNLRIAEIHTQGVYVLACSGGFGMSFSRHCAMLHALSLGQQRLWILDDNVESLLAPLGGPAKDLDDTLLDTFVDLPALSYSNRTPLILERAVTVDLQRIGERRFCPYFAYNKDDKSLEEAMKAADGFDYATAAGDAGYWPGGCKKADKGGFLSDSQLKAAKGFNPRALDYRKALEMEIARLPIWYLEGTDTAVDILELCHTAHASLCLPKEKKKQCSDPREVMRWHEDALWRMMAADPKVAALLAAEWFRLGLLG